jgi:hypothetical protein
MSLMSKGVLKMPSAATFKAINYAIALGIAVALCGPAKAATGAPARPDASVTRPTVTDVHWVWRHHHKYWVSDRRHY